MTKNKGLEKNKSILLNVESSEEETSFFYMNKDDSSIGFLDGKKSEIKGRDIREKKNFHPSVN